MLFILLYAFKSIILQKKFQTAKHNKSTGWTKENQEFPKSKVRAQ